MSGQRSGRDRSRSPYHDDSRSERRRRRRRRSYDEGHQDRPRAPPAPVLLPFNQRALTKYDLPEYRPMFAAYLDIQKRIDLEHLPEEEVKGRWKSFFKKWNRGGLAEGWYDPKTLTKAKQADIGTDGRGSDRRADAAHDADDDEASDFGPAAPHEQNSPVLQVTDSAARAGPSVPSLQELRSRHEDARLEAESARERRIAETRMERRLDRKTQTERLEDIAPRAEAGTRERQLEKKRDVAASNREFAAAKNAVGEVEVGDGDLMGEDSLSELKRMKKEQERRKTEREIKREEFLRARAAEREERSKRMREKEAKTMDMLKELARARFGDGNQQAATLTEQD